MAIARALANRPQILLADEPTGQLDSETGHAIMLLIRSIVRTEGVTAIVATHDPIMLDVADRVVELRDGRLTEAPRLTPAVRRPGHDQNIVEHQGVRSVAKSRSAVATAPGSKLLDPSRGEEIDESEGAEVGGRQVGDVEGEVGRVVGPLDRSGQPRRRCSSRQRPAFKGQSASRTLEDQRAGRRVRPPAERLGHIEEPEPDPVGDGQPQLTRLGEDQLERVRERAGGNPGSGR